MIKRVALRSFPLLFLTLQMSPASTFYEIVNFNSGKVLDVPNSSASNGAQIQQWDSNGGGNQHWNVISLGNNTFKIENVNSGKALEVPAWQTQNGVLIDQYDYLGGANSQWKIIPLGNGYSEIQNVNSGKALEVPAWQTQNGVLIDQYDYLGGANSQWQLVPVEPNISTVAGNGTDGVPTDNVPATQTTVGDPNGIAVDKFGNLYIAETTWGVVRKVDTNGNIITVAGNTSGFGYSGDGGPATSATFGFIYGLAVDNNGNLYIGDNTNRIRKVDQNGIVSTYVGTGVNGYSGDGGPATSAQIGSDYYFVTDSSGTLYLSDTQNNRVRKVTPDGIISTVAGNGSSGRAGDGGLATNAQLTSPSGLALDQHGNLYIADGGNGVIRVVNSAGIITTLSGTPYPPNGYNLAVDSEGDLYFDSSSTFLSKRDVNGNVSIVAGQPGNCQYAGDGGSAASALLCAPSYLAITPSGKVFISDTGNYRVRAIQ